jgi:hypothetical protein
MVVAALLGIVPESGPHLVFVIYSAEIASRGSMRVARRPGR